MPWLIDPPTMPGWYWIKKNKKKKVVHVQKSGDKNDYRLFTNENERTSVEDEELYGNVVWWHVRISPPPN